MQDVFSVFHPFTRILHFVTVLQQFTEIDLRENKVGIYSRPAKLTDQLKDGDRIEIYRPLLADPKEIRRKRAAEQAKAAQEKAQQEKQEKE